ncbi:MAG: hypothetical protein ACR2RE_10190 [Geminicoccaceae bacterium]
MERCNCLIAPGVTLMSASAQADTFYLKDGSVIEGTIPCSLDNTFSIKLDISGMYQLPKETVDAKTQPVQSDVGGNDQSSPGNTVAN